MNNIGNKGQDNLIVDPIQQLEERQREKLYSSIENIFQRFIKIHLARQNKVHSLVATTIHNDLLFIKRPLELMFLWWWCVVVGFRVLDS